MVAAFLSELVKLRQRTYWLMAAAMVAFMAITMVMSVGGAGDAPSDRGPAAHLLASDVDTSAWRTGEGLTATIGGVAGLTVAVLGWACLGVLAGILLRSAPVAIGVTVAYALPVEILLAVFAEDQARWLPGQLFQALARGGTPDVNATTALLGSLAWAATAIVVAALIFRRRDVTC